LHKLQEKAQAEGTTVSELLRYAIGLSEYLEFMRAKGALVFVVRPDGSTTEILSRIPPTYLIPGREEVRNQIELVKSVQNALKELAKRDNDPRLDPGEPDGDYGLKTKQAISVLQAKEHLPVTGVVDSRTLVELVHS
jgi:peptidoglycan hydrolase-like protein with peptidoglycan-binding domain